MDSSGKSSLFWDTKPMSVDAENDLGLVQENHGFQQPEIPDALEWDMFEPNKANTGEFLEFLQEYYHTSRTPFQIVYQESHIQFELKNPQRSWVVVLRRRLNRKIVACIAGDVRDYVFVRVDKDGNRTEDREALKGVLVIEFLCVIPSLRTLGIAPKLITEISRIAHDHYGIQKAYYNSVTLLTGEFCKTTNYHYPLHVLRCIERDYAFPTKEELKHLLKRVPDSEKRVKFIVLNKDSPEDLKKFCCEVLLEEFRRTKKIYEEITMDQINLALESSSIWIIAAISADHHYLGCIWTTSHPYKILNKKKPLNRMLTVLLYHYGFMSLLKKHVRRRIFEEFYMFARDNYDLLQWDAITATQEEAYTAVEGFQKGHDYYHYLYNIRMIPLEPNELINIGI
jgi:hypothetical protein